MMVTKKCIPHDDWSKLRCNTEWDYWETNTKPIAVLGAVSREKGIELIMNFPKSVKL